MRIAAILLAISLCTVPVGYIMGSQLAAQQDVPIVPVPPNQIAVPVTEVPSNALPDHGAEQVSWGLVAMLLLQWMKKSNMIPVISDEDTARVKATWGFVMALLSAAGIHFAISGSLFDTGGMAITITGVSWTAIKDVVFQWAFQQAWYQGLMKRGGGTTINQLQV